MSKIRLHGSSSFYTEMPPVAASGNNTLTLPNDGTIISKDSNGAVGVTSVHHKYNCNWNCNNHDCKDWCCVLQYQNHGIDLLVLELLLGT